MARPIWPYARRAQPARLRLAYGSRPSRAAVAKSERGRGKAHELLCLSRNPDEPSGLPRLVRSPPSPHHLHHPAAPPHNQKTRIGTQMRGTFRIAVRRMQAIDGEVSSRELLGEIEGEHDLRQLALPIGPGAAVAAGQHYVGKVDCLLSRRGDVDD